MKKNDLANEHKSKKNLGIKDFSLLSTSGTIGFYQECELTHIYVIEKKTNSIYHYFAILSYEEFLEKDENLRDIKLSDSLIKINKHYSLGIVKMRITLTEGMDIFTQLCNGSLTFKGKKIIIPQNFQLLPKTHIPGLWGYNGVMLSKILKPNLWGHRYIIEFISLDNPLKEAFSSDDFNKINKEIKRFLPIDLSSVYDRIGSFIFQFPITLVSGNAGISQDWCKAQLSIEVHPNFNHTDDLFTIVNTRFDDIVTGFNTFEGIFQNIDLDLGDSNNLEFKVFNKKNGLIYINSMGNYLKDFVLNFGFGMQNSEPRTIKYINGKIDEIELISHESSKSTQKLSYDIRTRNRILQNEIISKSGRFRSFYSEEREEALEYIRKILNDTASSSLEIWLWDPFLRQKDIFETLYYVRSFGITMKCITSFKKKKLQGDDKKHVRGCGTIRGYITSFKKKKNQEKGRKKYNKFKKSQITGFIENSNNLGINLELRAVHGNFGFDFHDRFLFFIPKNSDEIPTVYSLGASVNSLGKTHHLIQQTLDPRNIVKAFQELWDLLNNNESLIIKLPQDK
jgi:hypothetical protein